MFWLIFIPCWILTGYATVWFANFIFTLIDGEDPVGPEDLVPLLWFTLAGPLTTLLLICVGVVVGGEWLMKESAAGHGLRHLGYKLFGIKTPDCDNK